MISSPKASFYVDLAPGHGRCRCVLEIGFGTVGLYAMKCDWPEDRELDSIVCGEREPHPAFAERVCEMIGTRADHDTVARLVAAFTFVRLNADVPDAGALPAKGGQQG